MGVTSGSVVFNCGTIMRAGPHRAVLTVGGGHVEAVSPLLQVAWPPVSLRVPAAIETYASNVEIVVAFTTTICTPLLSASSGSRMLHPKCVLFFTLNFNQFLIGLYKSNMIHKYFLNELDMLLCNDSTCVCSAFLGMYKNNTIKQSRSFRIAGISKIGCTQTQITISTINSVVYLCLRM